MLLLKQSEPWMKRLADEYYSLDYRIDALECYIQKRKNSKIKLYPETETPIELFEEQLVAMKKYRDCLVDRAAIEGIVLDIVDVRNLKISIKKEEND